MGGDGKQRKAWKRALLLHPGLDTRMWNQAALNASVPAVCVLPPGAVSTLKSTSWGFGSAVIVFFGFTKVLIKFYLESMLLAPQCLLNKGQMLSLLFSKPAQDRPISGAGR